MDQSINKILFLMNEEMPMAGTTSVLSGGAAAQGAEEVGMDIMPSDYAPDGIETHEEDNCPIDPQLLEIAQELVAMAGGADKAREIIDKVQDVQEVLGIDDMEAIAGFADTMPDEPDLPSNRHNELGMSAMYDPGGNTHM